MSKKLQTIGVAVAVTLSILFGALAVFGLAAGTPFASIAFALLAAVTAWVAFGFPGTHRHTT